MTDFLCLSGVLTAGRPADPVEQIARAPLPKMRQAEDHPPDPMSLSGTSLRQEQHIPDESPLMTEAVRNLRSLILAGERYRQTLAEAIGLGTTECQTLSYLEVHGKSGQSELARDLGLTSSALTALVDRLERQGVAERVRHPRDRRRTIIQLTERGTALVFESHRWLTATLEKIETTDLERVSASLATIADDLFTRTSGHQGDSWSEVARALPA